MIQGKSVLRTAEVTPPASWSPPQYNTTQPTPAHPSKYISPQRWVQLHSVQLPLRLTTNLPSLSPLQRAHVTLAVFVLHSKHKSLSLKCRRLPIRNYLLELLSEQGQVQVPQRIPDLSSLLACLWRRPHLTSGIYS